MLAALGLGAMAKVPKKLGISTASSAEAEVAPAGERLPKRAWLRRLRAEQGGSGKEGALLQGSKSAAALQSRHPCSECFSRDPTNALRILCDNKGLANRIIEIMAQERPGFPNGALAAGWGAASWLAAC